MAKFIQKDNRISIHDADHEFHMENVNTADLIAEAFNQNIIENPCSLVYDSNLSQVRLHDTYADFDFRPHLSKIIADQINTLFKFDREFDNRDSFLIVYLESLDIYFAENNKKDVKLLFKNLDLRGFFGEISGIFLKHKINQKIDELED